MGSDCILSVNFPFDGDLLPSLLFLSLEGQSGSRVGCEIQSEGERSWCDSKLWIPMALLRQRPI